MWGWALVQIAVVLLSSLIQPKRRAEIPKPGAIGDKDIPIASQSTAIPVVFGTVHLTQPNVVWWTRTGITAVKKEAGGKK